MYKNIFFHTTSTCSFSLSWRSKRSAVAPRLRKTNYISIKIMTSENHGDYYKTLLNK